jgi:hypothetical protein
MSLSASAMKRLAALEILASDEPFVAVALPGLRLESRANDHRSLHWAGRAKTSKAHRTAAALVLASYRLKLRKVLKLRGLVVRLVRIGPRQLDSHDNLGMATKALTDGVAAVLGVDDRDERVAFVPDAEVGAWGARVEFYEGDS